ncbi:ABC transporter permease [Aerococcus suis]|uniref:Glycine betaine/proline transport system substrate-binding protein n=1 Tax=Aerococcus suis TaxID=371602 RepID=A0A1W1YVP5_9LACT|nr:glycine betaine/proline transport system substrate-binding protein [Aerococcus suis]
MNSLFAIVPHFPVADWVEAATDWLTQTLGGMFDVLQTIGQTLIDGLTSILSIAPPALFIVLIAVLAYFASEKKWGLPVFVLIGFGYVLNQGLWSEMLNTISLILVSSLVSIIIGVPLGILSAKSEVAHAILKPILDFMQTMPAFVYLIPAVAFFGIGVVPGVFASVIFSLPPTVRFTDLGIRQISNELIEAADSFGSSGPQKLFKVELPLAKSTIMAGVNQTTMLALSMVVIGSMIGAPGLGRQVLSSLQRAEVGTGFVSGLGIVVLAIVIDRLTQALARDKKH